MRVLRALVEDGLHADGVGVLERATTERREADAHDQTHVGFGRRLDDAVAKAARRLDDHRQHVPINDLFVAHVDLALLDRSEEHTSELQSLMRISYAVFCLKQKTNTRTYYIS